MRAGIFWALSALTGTAVLAQKVSNTGRCGASYGGLVCTGSSFGNCCSGYGYCGSTTDHCGTSCNAAYGSCKEKSTTVSPNGSCGGTKGYTCKGSTFGSCCSQYGYCGSTSAYCGTGCNTGFGDCSNAQSSSIQTASTLRTSTRSSSTLATSTRSSSVASAASPSSSVKVSMNGRCGSLYGATGGFSCLGSSFGDCCSKYSYCGSTSAYCGTGCQLGFGKCTTSSSSSINPSSSSTRLASSTPTTSSAITSSSIVFPSLSSVESSTVQSSPVVSSTAQSSSAVSPVQASSSVASTTVQSSSAASSTVQSSSPVASTVESSSAVSSTAQSSSAASSSAVQGSSAVSSTVQSSSAASSSAFQSSSAASSSAFQSSSAASSSEVQSSSAASSSAVQSSSVASSTVESSSVVSSTVQSSSAASSSAVQSSSAASSTAQSSSSEALSTLVSSLLATSSTAQSSSSADASTPQSSLSEASSTLVSSSSASSTPGSSSPVVTSTPGISTSPGTSSQIISTTPVDVASSSASVSATPIPSSTPSPTPSCIPRPTNYVTNGGFENGDATGFTFIQMGNPRITFASPGYTGNYLARFSGASMTTTIVEYTQTQIRIPAGTVVNVFAYIRGLRTATGGTHTFRVSFDGTSIYSAIVTGNSWTKYGADAITVVGDVHTVTIRAFSANYAGDFVEVDDISIIPFTFDENKPPQSALHKTRNPQFALQGLKRHMTDGGKTDVAIQFRVIPPSLSIHESRESPFVSYRLSLFGGVARLAASIVTLVGTLGKVGKGLWVLRENYHYAPTEIDNALAELQSNVSTLKRIGDILSTSTYLGWTLRPLGSYLTSESLNVRKLQNKWPSSTMGTI